MRFLTVLMVLAGGLFLAGCVLNRDAPQSDPQVAEVGEGESTAASTPQMLGQYLQAIGNAPAGAAVTKGLQPFFPLGIGFCVLGGLAFFFRMRANGVILSALGVSYVAVAVLFIQYPFVVLVPPLIACLIFYERLKEKRRGDDAVATVEVLTEKIEKRYNGMSRKSGGSARFRAGQERPDFGHF